MDKVKNEIAKKLKEVLKDLDTSEVSITISHPTDSSKGDYSTNIAMVLAKKLGKNPLELANEIKDKLGKIDGVEKIDAAAPGFLNFWISKDNLFKNLSEIINKGDINSKNPTSLKLRGTRILVEFAHPNTHKEFHIGHLRNITVGESITRILDNLGATTRRANYQGDVGLHVAKALYGIEKLGNILDMEDKSLKEKAKFLGKAYALGSKSYEEDDKAKEKIININKKIYSKDKDILPLWQKTRQWSLDYFDSIYKRLDSKFDRFYFESEVFELGKNIVLSHIEDGIFEKSDGAIIFDGERYGLHKRVFITSEGNPTYEGKEMGLGELEYKEFPFDEALHVVGPEQAGYFKVAFKALELINPSLKDKEKHLQYGFVQLRDGKMSSRLGNVIAGEWLLDEAKKKVSEAFAEMDEETAEIVSVGAVKYSMLKFSRDSDISFSFEDSISLEGNSGPYIQYTFARTQSVLAKKKAESKVENLDLEKEESELIRALFKFGEVVEEAGNSFAPNILCQYLFELCQKYNLFYQKHKIIGGEKEEFRLSLTKAVGQVIKNGLYLLGIKSPKKM